MRKLELPHTKYGKVQTSISKDSLISFITIVTRPLVASSVTVIANEYFLKAQTVKRLNATPVIDTEGLKSHEIALLILITNNSFSNEDGISVWYLKDEMNKSGYTDIATSVGVRTLTKNEMIETFKDTDYNSNEYVACKLTEKGINWILTNQDLLEFRQPSKNQEKIIDDFPF